LMELRRSDIEHLASLAKLHLDADEAASILKDLTRVLEYMRVLDEIDTAGVDPAANAPGRARPASRHDEPAPGLSAEDALKAAPSRHDGHFLLPKVIER
jgi:aspartyl-tRNA(Asn)/glutamyl-tRNA(Gln) amidotransferase subunit C